MKLPAFAAEHRHLQHGARSCRSISGAQQQTGWPPLLLPVDGIDALPLHRLCPADSVNNSSLKRVSWTAKKTNEWVINKAGVKRELLDTVKARKLAYYGHTMRKQGSCLEKEIT